MSSPASFTLILVTTSRLVRADFDSSGPAPKSFWTEMRAAGSALPDAVALALSFGGKAGRQVWVLCEEAWTQSLDLARGQVSGLTHEQLARALSFEVEPFSGIPVAESALGFRETGERHGQKTYWITELTLNVRGAIQRAVTAAGGKLAGICHPGGVPRPLSAQGQAGERAWRRLEAWDGNFVWLEGDARGEVRSRVLTAAPVLPPPLDDTVFEALGSDLRALVATLDPAIAWDQFSFEDEALLRHWLSLWAASVQRGQPPVPIVLPPAPKPNPRRFLLAAVAIEAATLALCVLHWFFASAERDDLKKQVADIIQTNQQVQARAKDNAALRKQLEELEDRAQKRGRLAERRGSMPALLRALASTRPDDVVLSSIQPGGPGALTVNGVALEALSVDEMSMVLTETLRPAGWIAQPMQKSAKGTLPNAGPWEFAIRVSQEATIPTVSSPAPKTHR